MAEKDLDSFFAKKDKSKKKSKSAITIDDLAPADGEKKKKKKKNKDKSKDKDAPASVVISKEEDAEWNDFESEEKDYSGLKIQNLQISKEEEEENDEAVNNSDSDEDGERKDPGQQGPWNRLQGEGGSSEPQEPTPAPAPSKPEPAPVAAAAAKPGKYISPHLRKQMENPEPVVARVPRKPKVAPNLQNMEDFPTLGAGPMPQEVDTDSRQFERVRQGGRSSDYQQASSRVEVGNKFGALSYARD